MNRITKYYQTGFTLVELMVVIAIISFLSAVAAPQYKKYQAKAKIPEALMQLSGIYTAEQAFFADYNMYHSCLSYMGYNPIQDMQSRYYTTGIGQGDPISPTALASAINSGLNVSAFSTDSCREGFSVYVTFWPGWKGVGNLSMVNDLVTTCPTGLGDQATEATMIFIAGAVGAISATHTELYGAKSKSCFTINQNKKISNLHTGF